MKISSFASFCWFGLLLGRSESLDQILSLHGSGATSIEHCFGNIIEELEAHTKKPIRITYRGTGSSTALKEFKNDFNVNASATDFGAGEIPVPTEDWQGFQDRGVTILQLPTFFSAVSFFHSVPGIPNLNLTACLLARIFSRDIKDWAHPDIRELNPGLDILFDEENANSLGASLRIRVARRQSGSSNTKSITEYLHQSCPRHFPESMVGSLPDWPLDTETCQGNSGMVECIKSRAGTIGYMTSGAGHENGLQEISLTNKFGRRLTSQDAIRNNGVGAKGFNVLPSSPTDDFGAVNLIDQDGEWTWPLTLLTYMYIRADVSFIPDANARSLLVAFLKSLYKPEYNTICSTKYDLILPTGSALEVAMKGVDILEQNLGAESATWTFESNAEAMVGTGDYVISSIRRNFAASERLFNYDEMAKVLETVALLEERLANATAMLEDTGFGRASEGLEFTETEETKLDIAFILSIVSLGLVLSLGVLIVISSRSKAGDAEQEGPKRRSYL